MHGMHDLVGWDSTDGRYWNSKNPHCISYSSLHLVASWFDLTQTNATLLQEIGKLLILLICIPCFEFPYIPI